MDTPTSWLSAEELIDLTHKERSSAQAKALRAMAIPYFRRPDGSLVVSRRTFDAPSSQGPTPTPMRLPQTRRVLAG